MKIAVYPGSFDPCTNGHLDVITRCAKVFDQVIVAVLCNSNKSPTFSVEERMSLLKSATRDIPNVKIDCFSGLLTHYMAQKKSNIIIKGLRAVSDFEYEFQMALTNSKLNPDVETFFITTSAQNLYLSSSIVKEVARLGGSISDMVPACIEQEINDKLK